MQKDGAAEICYADASGCRIERVTAPPVEVTISSSRVVDASATARVAVVKAVAMLGNAGWEMVAVGNAYGHVVPEFGVHFRRVER